MQTLTEFLAECRDLFKEQGRDEVVEDFDRAIGDVERMERCLAKDRRIAGELIGCIINHVPPCHWPPIVRQAHAEIQTLRFRGLLPDSNELPS